MPLRAGGGAAGLTLTAAAHVVFLEPGLDPGLEAQARARVHRLGQARPVTVLRLAYGGTLEETLLDATALPSSMIAVGTDEAPVLARAVYTTDGMEAALDVASFEQGTTAYQGHTKRDILTDLTTGKGRGRVAAIASLLGIRVAAR